MIKKRSWVVILFILFFLSVNLLPGCTGGQKQGVGMASDELLFFNGESEDQFSSTGNQDNLHSLDKIAESLSEGRLDEELAAVLSVLSVYNQEQLPEEYRGEPGDSAQFSVRYLIDNWDSLSEDTKKTVEPYILPIDNPGSFFNPAYKTKNVSSSGPLSLCVANAADEDRVVKTQFTHDNQSVTIQYVEKAIWDQKGKQLLKDTVLTVKEIIIHAWNDYKPYMKTTLTVPLLVELIPMGQGSYGEEETFTDHHRIRLNYRYSNNTKLIKSTTAHELFHSFQDELKIRYFGTEEKWFCEATAVWAENFALPDLNFEHTRHSGFFERLGRDRINYGDDFEYDSYMLFYYLTDYAKVNFIRELTLENAKKGNSSIRPYLNKHIPNLRDTYGEFALYNWNQGPVKKYNDFGPITGVPIGDSLLKKEMGPSQEDSQEVDVHPGSLKYYYYTFTGSDEELQHVRVTFDDTLQNDEYIKRQAIIRINGKWVVEDWSDITEKTYCRLQDKKVDALVLVYSNGDFTEEDKYNVDRFVVRTEKCHTKMELSLTATFDYAVEDFVWHSESKFEEYLDIQDHCLFLIKEASYDFKGSGDMEGKNIIATNANFSYFYDEPKLGESLSRIVLNLAENLDGAKEGFKQFSIKDNIPPAGILITVPALPEEEPTGKTTLSLGGMVGTMDINTPLIFDGLTQLGGVIPEITDWTSEGIEFSREIDLTKYKSPLANMFTVDFSVLQNQLSMLEGINDMPEIPNVPGMPEMPDTGMGDTSSLSALSDIFKMMTMQVGAPGAKATVKLHIKGIYVEEIMP